MDYIAIIVIIITIFLLSGSKDISDKLYNNKILLILVIVYFVYNHIHFGILLIILFGYLLYDDDLRSELINYYHNVKSSLPLEHMDNQEEIEHINDEQEIEYQNEMPDESSIINIDEKDINDEQKKISD